MALGNEALITVDNKRYSADAGTGRRAERSSAAGDRVAVILGGVGGAVWLTYNDPAWLARADAHDHDATG